MTQPPETGKVVERPSPLTGLARGGIALVAAAWLISREFLEGQDMGLGLPMIGLIALAYAVLAGVSGILTWRMTTFVADDDEFRIERRLISRSSSRIAYTKVQSVDIHQPLIARVLGLAKVHIDVGGAGGADLVYLPLSRAESLRDHLIARMQQAKLPPAPPAPPAPAVTAAVAPETLVPLSPASQPTPPRLPAPEIPPVVAPVPAPEELIVQVTPRNLLLGAFFSSGTIWWLLFAVGLLIMAIVVREPIAFLPALIAVAGWVWNRTGKNWGFVMTRRGDALHISRGAVNKAAQGLHPSRIQGVAIRQDLLHRLVGLYSVSVTVLGYGDVGSENEGNNALVLPYGTSGDVAAVLAAIWPDVHLGGIVPQVQPERARWLTPITFRTHTWGVDDVVTVAQHGLFTQTRTIVPHRRMQSASLHQGPLERKLGLATVAIHTTDGPVTLRLYHLDQALARRVLFEQIRLARLARAAADH